MQVQLIQRFSEIPMLTITRDVCKTLTSRPFAMKHLPRSSPYLVHDETKSFGSTPLPHPLDATAKI